MGKQKSRKDIEQNDSYDYKENNKTESYVVAYTPEDEALDEKNFNKALTENKVDWTSFKRLMVRDLCVNTQILNTGFIGNINLNEAVKALESPKNNWRILLEISKELMHNSTHYYRLNTLYSNIALFNWWIDLYDVKDNVDVDVVKKIYSRLTTKFEHMNIKHEFKKIMRVLPYQDIYCGLVIESDTDFFFQEVDYRVCRLYQIQDGLYNFDIDLSKINPKNLSAYPDYVQEAYISFCDNGGSKWYLPPSDKQICLKFNYQWAYPYPFLIGLVKDILDLNKYKKLKLQSARTDNYKAILIKVPIDTTTVDKPLLSPDTLGMFAEINRESMTDDIGMIHTLGNNAEAISFKDSNNTRNNVSDAVDEIYNSSGTNKNIFNGATSGTAMTFSVENDSGYIYDIYRQIERWCNRFIKIRKFNKQAFKFNFYILDMTIFNRDNVSKRYKEACTLGATVVDKWLASLDMTPSRMLGSYVLHKDIFKFSENFVPLSSTYTVSSNDSNGELGRPSNSSKGELLDVEGEKTADNDKHDI